jgi:hypothetical protein
MATLILRVTGFITGIALVILLKVSIGLPIENRVLAQQGQGCITVPFQQVTNTDHKKYLQFCSNCDPALIVYICQGEGVNCNPLGYYYTPCPPPKGPGDIEP